MDNHRVRVVLIGTGGVARSHVDAVRGAQHPVELVAAMDIVAERVQEFCRSHDIPRAYVDLDQMLAAEKPDLALIATPPFTHAELCVRCMEAGAWVLCEKPLVASLAELARIDDAESSTGNYCSSIFQWRFGSGGQHLKRLIDSGALGKPLVCNSLITWYRTPEYYAVPWRGKWETEVGGTTMNHGIHAMDFVLWLLGDWTEVRAMIGTLDRQIEVEDVSMASVRFANGAMANLTNSAVSPRETSYVRFDFQRATVELTHLYSYRNADWVYTIHPDASYRDDLATWQMIGADVPSSHGAQLNAMFDSMAKGERPPVSGSDVRPTIEFLASLYKSAIEGRPVKRGTIGPDDPFYRRMCGPCDQTWQLSSGANIDG